MSALPVLLAEFRKSREHGNPHRPMIAVASVLQALSDAWDTLDIEKNRAYHERNMVIAWAARMAKAIGYEVWVARNDINGWEPEWLNCVHVLTPAGQVSWHFHDSGRDLFAEFIREGAAWDEHTTPEKYRRVLLAQYVPREFNLPHANLMQIDRLKTENAERQATGL